MTIELTKDNVESLIENNEIVVIDFWAEWCGPCKAFGPVFDKVAEQHPEITFAKCNTEQQMEVASMFAVRSIPTLAVFREKVLLMMQPGALPEQALEEILTKIKDLDMDEVRAEIDKERARPTGESDDTRETGIAQM